MTVIWRAVIVMLITSAVASADIIDVDVDSNFYLVISNVPGVGTNNCTIAPNDVVRWTWQFGLHSVTSDDGAFDSSLHFPPHTFSVAFPSEGTFGYHCSLHGAPGVGMFGTVIVQNNNPLPCPGDLNGDRRVNESDLGILLQSWQSGPGGDADGDGDTDESDLGILLQNWQVVCP